MNTIGCDRLDDFLDHDLHGADRLAFVDHMESCAACREAAAGHQLLALRLRAGLDRTDSTPPMLATRVEDRIRWARVRGFAVSPLAASVAFVGVWLAVDRPQHGIIAPPPVVMQDRPAEESPVRIRFPNRDVIAMPVASDSPHVTVVIVYPELQASASAPLERNER